MREVFDRVADRYDVMNDLMSAGMHRVWKNHFVHQLAPVRGMSVLDLASGTGDIAFKIAAAMQHSSPAFQPSSPSLIIASDINKEMMSVGQQRMAEHRGSEFDGTMMWVQADAEAIPIPSASLDAVTIVFGLRNVTTPANALCEARRVLKRGGRFMCMEFAQVHNDAMRAIYDEYSLHIIPAIGEAVVGDGDPYKYLVESIRAFPKQREVKLMMCDAGLAAVAHEDLVQGAVAIYSGFRL